MAHINLSDASPEYLALARKCILLTDVCSQMSRDWINDGKPYDNPNITNFDWSPTNNCASDPDDQYHKFKFQDIIWTSFRYGSVKVEPAAFIATHPGHPKTAFLIYRGSQTGADFGLDFQYDTVPNPLGAGRTEVGFTKYFKGLGLNATDDRNIGKKVPGFTLYDTLKRLNQTDVRHLIVSGHSLGSTTATLSGAYAIEQQFFNTVETYVSASPQVGDFNFGVWYDDLKDSDGNELYKNTYRLTNTADGVPKEPNKSAPAGKKSKVSQPPTPSSAPSAICGFLVSSPASRSLRANLITLISSPASGATSCAIWRILSSRPCARSFWPICPPRPMPS